MIGFFTQHILKFHITFGFARVKITRIVSR